VQGFMLTFAAKFFSSENFPQNTLTSVHGQVSKAECLKCGYAFSIIWKVTQEMNTVMVLQSLFARPIRSRLQISTILPHLVSHFGVEAWRVV